MPTIHGEPTSAGLESGVACRAPVLPTNVVRTLAGGPISLP